MNRFFFFFFGLCCKIKGCSTHTPTVFHRGRGFFKGTPFFPPLSLSLADDRTTPSLPRAAASHPSRILSPSGASSLLLFDQPNPSQVSPPPDALHYESVNSPFPDESFRYGFVDSWSRTVVIGAPQVTGKCRGAHQLWGSGISTRERRDERPYGVPWCRFAFRVQGKIRRSLMWILQPC